MIRDIELLQGAAILRVLQFKPGIQVTQMVDFHSSLYKIISGADTAMILLKLSTRRKAPWQYVFSEFEQKAIDNLRIDGICKIFFGFICHTDGVCCVPVGLLEKILDGAVFSRKAVSINRSEGKSYRITGPQRRKFKRTFSINSWPRMIFEEIE